MSVAARFWQMVFESSSDAAGMSKMNAMLKTPRLILGTLGPLT